MRAWNGEYGGDAVAHQEAHRRLAAGHAHAAPSLRSSAGTLQDSTEARALGVTGHSSLPGFAECGRHPPEPDTLLLQAEVRIDPVVAETVVERTLLGGEPRQVPVDRAVLGASQRLEREQDAPVHQELLHVVETGA